VAAAIGFAAFFGLAPTILVRITDLPFPFDGTLLAPFGLQPLASPALLSGVTRTAGEVSAPMSPDRTPIPAPNSIFHAVAQGQGGFALGGLLAVLFFTLLTAPPMGRQLRVPATSWWSPGYVSRLELPG
jgi:hypothetical protein